MSPVAEDLSGQKFNRWLVISKAANKGNGPAFNCVCDCGTERVVRAAALKSEQSKSCGCRHIEAVSKPKENTRRIRLPNSDIEYHAWKHMRQRCNNPDNKSYDRYGERGIQLCERWNIFDNFFADMGNRPEGMVSIDRINNDGGYTCGKCEECVANGWAANCRWADDTTQARNKSSNRYITVDGETKLLAEWAEITGINASTISTRIDERGWTEEEAVKTPSQNKNGRRKFIRVLLKNKPKE